MVLCLSGVVSFVWWSTSTVRRETLSNETLSLFLVIVVQNKNGGTDVSPA